MVTKLLIIITFCNYTPFLSKGQIFVANCNIFLANFFCKNKKAVYRLTPQKSAPRLFFSEIKRETASFRNVSLPLFFIFLLFVLDAPKHIYSTAKQGD